MKKLALKTIKTFQGLNNSPGNCRFTPTCSSYSYQAIDKYGILNGSLLSLKRIFKCHPFNKGGKDEVPQLPV